MLFSLAVTEGVGYERGREELGMALEFIDVRRAYFHSKAIREVYVDLPKEDYQEGYCGRLLKAMYGTRDAALNWEYSYLEFMEKVGFRLGVASTCVFYHPEKKLRAVIHGDDFTLLGSDENLDWFRERIKERFEVKMRGRVGRGKGHQSSIRILNRVVEWGNSGINYEADQRHAEIIVDTVLGKERSRSLGTPADVVEVESGDDEKLDAQQSTL